MNSSIKMKVPKTRVEIFNEKIKKAIFGKKVHLNLDSDHLDSNENLHHLIPQKNQTVKNVRRDSVSTKEKKRKHKDKVEKVPFLQRIIIMPESKWKPIFDIWILLLVGYSCIFNILVVSFPIEESKRLQVVNQIIEAFFYTDFTLNFFTAYKDPSSNETVMELKPIARKYFFGWFSIDAVSIFPFNIFTDGPQSRATKLFRLARMPRLGKLLDTNKISKLLRSFDGEEIDHHLIVR